MDATFTVDGRVRLSSAHGPSRYSVTLQCGGDRLALKGSGPEIVRQALRDALRMAESARVWWAESEEDEMVNATYKASDGKEFRQRAEAEAWDAMLKEKEAYERALHRYILCVARALKTEDGKPFDMNEPHWALSWRDGLLYLEELAGLWEWNLVLNEGFNAEVHSVRKDVSYRVGGLFACKAAALEALAEALNGEISQMESRRKSALMTAASIRRIGK